MTHETEVTAPALSARIPSAGEVEAALTLWWGEPPREDSDADDGLLNRVEMSDAIRAAEFVRDAERKVRNRLFNCCTDEAAPDWSLFSGLEIGGCITGTDDNGSEFTEGGYSDAEAEFWTIYGRLKEGGCEAITDCVSRAEAAKRRAAGQLSRTEYLAGQADSDAKKQPWITLGVSRATYYRAKKAEAAFY